MDKPLRFSELSTPRKSLIRLCQSTNYRHIQDLVIRDQEPVLTSCPPLVLADIRLDVEDRRRDEIALPDFVLCAEFHRLLALLDEIKDGKISRIEIRAGVPRRLTLEKPLAEGLIGRDHAFDVQQLLAAKQAGSRDPVRRTVVDPEI
jgi:hypothetical protein